MKIPGVGPAYLTKLRRLGINTEKDLLYHLPFRYDDFSDIRKISNATSDHPITIKGTIVKFRNVFTRKGTFFQKATVKDETGELSVVWFNQMYLSKILRVGTEVSLAGKVVNNQMESPQYEIGTNIHSGRLVPIYPETAGVTSKWLRPKIYQLLRNLNIRDFLPPGNFMELQKALQKVHFPDSLEEAVAARERLAFDELLMAQIEAQSRRDEWQKHSGRPFKIIPFTFSLPYKLTRSQEKVITEIYSDLQKDVPMNRLLQGDVGSGKTIVAAHAIRQANLNGYSAVLMAPTEILVHQHFETLKSLGFKVGIATTSKKDFENKDVVVGTQALLFSKLTNLGLVVIDEQHRFGVEQRAKLSAKGKTPHTLTMTATPIPRTIALTLYGDLDLSVIEEMPKNRLPVKTWFVPESKREGAYEWIKKQKTQTFVICPFIEESESMQTIKAATVEFEKIKKIFSPQKVGLVHGKLKQKDKIITEFKTGKLDILVATPVVEVGIDIPSATIILIEGADRFGLAQIHQLRGRVGRGNQQSYCLIFGENANRLKLLEKLNSGLDLAEADLRHRGPGQRFGTSQHGRWDLKIADFSNLELIEKANAAAKDPIIRQAVIATVERLVI